MSSKWTVSSILFSILINYYCRASEHAFGYGIYDHEYFHKEVAHNRGSGLKNYTLIFNLIGEGDGIKDITYVKIDVHSANSKGEIKVSDKKVNAKIHIDNVYSFSASIYVHGENDYPYSYLQLMQQIANENSHLKSLTFVYVRKASPSSKQSAQNAFGNRRDGDKLLHFESRNVTNFSRFPSRAFQYSGNEYITYVGFSFNSPTAMAMVNTSFVGEQEFNGIVYDMNTEHFMANMSVYGIDSEKKPDNCLSICGL